MPRACCRRQIASGVPSEGEADSEAKAASKASRTARVSRICDAVCDSRTNEGERRAAAGRRYPAVRH